MFVRGIVSEIDRQSGVIDNGGGLAATAWATVHCMIGAERVKFPHRIDPATGVASPRGSLVVPAEGDEVEVLVDLDLKQSPNSLLQPFKLVIVALETTTLRTADEVAEARSSRSLTSAPSRRKSA